MMRRGAQVREGATDRPKTVRVPGWKAASVMFMVDPSALLLASTLAGLLALGVVGLSHGTTAPLRDGVRLWVLGDLALTAGRVLLLAQPGVLHRTGLDWLSPSTTAIANGALVITCALLHAVALRCALGERLPGRSIRALWLAPAYAAVALALPTHEARLTTMLVLTSGCICWTLQVVWPYRRQFRGAALIAGTMALFLVAEAAALWSLHAAPAATSVRQQLPPLPALVLDLAASLAMTLGFTLLQFERLHRRIDHLSRTDPLTGAVNRRGMLRQLDRNWGEARQRPAPISIAIFDLDHFKRINDTYGHAMGDAVLVGFVERVGACTRATDVLARWGGEEFVLLMPGTDPAQALQVAERVREAVAASPLALGAPIVTVSGGVTGTLTLPPDLQQDLFIGRADAGLYRAKQQRNCMVAEELPLAA